MSDKSKIVMINCLISSVKRGTLFLFLTFTLIFTFDLKVHATMPIEEANAISVDGPESEPATINLPDGEYAIEVAMAGGSGRASVSSPTLFIVKNKKGYARLLWSSTYYDYMIVGEKKYLNETTDGGNSTFTIPILAYDEAMRVVGDTTAMGEPVPILYDLTFYKESINGKGYVPQEAAKRVVIFALIIIVVGGILDYFVKKRRKA